MKNDLSLILIFSNRSNDLLNSYLDLLDIHGIEYKPRHFHITIGCYENVDVEEFIEYTKQFLLNSSKFSLKCSLLGKFTTGCIAFIPYTSDCLNCFYKEFHEKFDDYADQWTRLSNESWIPHISMYSNKNEEFEKVHNILMDAMKPFEIDVIGAEVSIMKDDGFDMVYRYEFT